MWFKRKKTIALSTLSIDYDFHTHLLPNVDDGKFTYVTASETISDLCNYGIKRINVTPHLISGLYDNPVKKFRPYFEELKENCSSLKCEPDLRLGAEYMCDDSFLKFIEEDAEGIFVLNDRCVLIEMSYFAQSPQIFDIVFHLRMLGYTPVLAHPERYPYWAFRENEFEKLGGMGCKFQMNLLSLSGVYGKTSLRILNYLLDNSLYSYVGTDIHSPQQLELIFDINIEEKIADKGERSGLWKYNNSPI